MTNQSHEERHLTDEELKFLVNNDLRKEILGIAGVDPEGRYDDPERNTIAFTADHLRGLAEYMGIPTTYTRQIDDAELLIPGRNLRGHIMREAGVPDYPLYRINLRRDDLKQIYRYLRDEM